MDLLRGTDELGPSCLSSRSEEERIKGVKEMMGGGEEHKRIAQPIKSSLAAGLNIGLLVVSFAPE